MTNINRVFGNIRNMVFGNIRNMTIQNMANVNMLIRKVYLLAGVIMAANMFIVNEVKASTFSPDTSQGINTNDNIQLKGNNNFTSNSNINNPGQKGEIPVVQRFLDRVLSLENTFNLIGGLVSSCANNYLKWWDYNPGTYCKFVWVGWRSKRFLNDILQFEVNLNLVRGVFWLISGAYNFIKGVTTDDYEDFYFKHLYVSHLIAIPFKNPIVVIVFFLLQGFASMPLTVKISKFNFSISISLDSIIWMGIGKILELKDEREEEDGAQTIESKNNEIKEE